MTLTLPIDTMQRHYDVVIVGSGYGGGVSAARLAQLGKRVCVLERGKEFETGQFPTRFPDIRRELQVTGTRMRTGSPSALFDFRQGRDIHVLVGCGVGGGSLINAAVAMRPDDRVFKDEAWPSEVADDGLIDEGFARARTMLRPAHHSGARDLVKFQALQNASRAFGIDPHAAPVVVNFEESVNAAGVAQAACTLCGDCCSGCNVGAKNTIALTYLPIAKRNGAEIFAQCRVRHLKRDGACWEIFFERLDSRLRGNGADTLSISADMVVLAAGTLGSTEILLRSREKGLPVSDQLGERFSANGDIIAFGYGAKVPVKAIGVGYPPKAEIGAVGACVSGQIEIRDENDLDKGMYIQEGALPSALAPLLPVLFLPGGKLLGAAQSLIKGVYNGPFNNLHTFFVVSHDDAKGKIVLNDDTITIDWPNVGDQDVYKRVDAVLKAAIEANGGSYVKNPLAGTFMGHTPATAHPLGGCGMGQDRQSGVIDHKCRVFDASASRSDAVHKGLYVCDGAMMPRSIGVNPLLTVSALSERAMLHLAKDLGLTDATAPARALLGNQPTARV